MLYSSVLSALAIRFLFVIIFGTVFYISYLASKLVLSKIRRLHTVVLYLRYLLFIIFCIIMIMYKILVFVST